MVTRRPEATVAKTEAIDNIIVDDIIIGAGSAGCVLAERLSADPSRRVLLLEAGPRDKQREVHIPAAFTKLFKTEVDWAYETEPEPHLNGRRLYWPRGKMLGGCSSLNAMLYVRGHRRDYDRWQEMGNPGWSFADVLPAFLRAEDQERGASKFHGVGGPLAVSDPRDPNPTSRAFVEAARELGWPINDDFNGEIQEGLGLYQVNQRRGARCSTAVAYLRPALSRPNLTVLTEAPATRVVLEGARARGVTYVHKGREKRALAERQIILCGGTVNSPQLLLLSGIGPADELREHGIRVEHDLPGVGRNLQDHPMVSVAYRVHQPITLDHAETLWNLLRYLLLRRGPLTTTVCEAGGFLHTRSGQERPDLQFHFLPAALLEHGFSQAADQGINFAPTLARPKSRGRITLQSTDPMAPPRILANYLAEPDDLDTLIAGVERARELAATEAMGRYRDVEVVPGSGVQGRKELGDFIRNTLETLYHPVGTCAMGPDPSAGAVVDARLKVHGVEGLRVVDASIMPEIITGNTNAPTIMIAERASEWILGE